MGRIRRGYGWAAAVTTFVLVVGGGVVSSAQAAPPAAAGTPCVDENRILTVDVASGHLAEIASCPSQSTFGPAAEVDTADWRGYRQLFAARDGPAVMLYAVTVDGQLWWRRQTSAGAVFSAPVRVGASVDWSRFSSVLASQPGYIQAVETGSPVLTYRHDQWTTGGSEVVPEAPLLTAYGGPSMMSARWGAYAEGVWAGVHYRIWRARHVLDVDGHDDLWYASGPLPAGLKSVSGTEPWLYAIASSGKVVLLRQPTPAPPPPRTTWDCPRQNPMPWQIAASSKDSYRQIVVPIGQSFADGPSLATLPSGIDCPQGAPYEWQ